MKINGNDPFVNSRLQVQQQEQKHEEQQQSEKVRQLNGVQDRLEFSAGTRELQGYLKKANEAPEVRAERIAEISRQLEAGTYNIKAEKVAEAIITGSLLDDLA